MKLIKLCNMGSPELRALGGAFVGTSRQLEQAAIVLRVRVTDEVASVWLPNEIRVGRESVFRQENVEQGAAQVFWPALNRRCALRIAVAHPFEEVRIEARARGPYDEPTAVGFEAELWGIDLVGLDATHWSPSGARVVRCDAGHDLQLHVPRHCRQCLQEIEGEALPCPTHEGRFFCALVAGHDGAHMFERRQ